MATCETTVIQLSQCELPSLVDNLNGTHTFDPGDGNVVTFPTKYVASGTYDTLTDNLVLTLSDGSTVTINIPGGTGAETVTTLVDNLDGSFTYTSEDATVTIWAESVTTLVDNLNDTYTYTSEDGTTTVIDTADVVTTLVDNLDNTFTYTSEDGTIVTIDFGDVVTTVVDNLDGTITYTDEAGSPTVLDICAIIANCSIGTLSDVDVTTTPPSLNNILKWDGTNWVPVAPSASSETITTLVDNLDNTFTYTSEDATITTIDFGETLTSLVDNLNGTFTYTDEDGTPVIIDVCTLLGYCTLTASDISDFDTEVSNNVDVAANTAARHVAVTVLDSTEIDFTLTGQQITASLVAGSIDETKLDVSVNASLDLADSSLQPSFAGSANIVTVGTVTSGNVDAVVSDANTTTKGKVELAIASEVTTGTDATRAVTPDSLAGSNYGIRVVSIQVTDPNGNALTVGDGKAYFRVPSVMNGWNLVAVAAHVTTVSSSGLPTVQIYNVTDTVDMLSTPITIDANEKDSKDATTAAVINSATDDVATGDELRIDVDVAGTGTKGLIVEMQFQLP